MQLIYVRKVEIKGRGTVYTASRTVNPGLHAGSTVLIDGRPCLVTALECSGNVTMSDIVGVVARPVTVYGEGRGPSTSGGTT